MVRVCFVCLGNICRSPTAEGVLRTLVERAGLAHAIWVESAGTAAYHIGSLPDARSRATARRRGYALESRAVQFQRSDFERFDWVLAMDQQNERDLLALARTPQERAKVHLLRRFGAGATSDLNVPDPYYGGAAGFETVLDICEVACSAWLEAWRRASLGSGAEPQNTA
jgi:protein-tyrosine phosphatase